MRPGNPRIRAEFLKKGLPGTVQATIRSSFQSRAYSSERIELGPIIIYCSAHVVSLPFLRNKLKGRLHSGR